MKKEGYCQTVRLKLVTCEKEATLSSCLLPQSEKVAIHIHIHIWDLYLRQHTYVYCIHEMLKSSIFNSTKQFEYIQSYVSNCNIHYICCLFVYLSRTLPIRFFLIQLLGFRLGLYEQLLIHGLKINFNRSVRTGNFFVAATEKLRCVPFFMSYFLCRLRSCFQHKMS